MPATHPLTFLFIQPADNAVVTLNKPFEVSGRVTDQGGAEPHVIDKITVQIDSGAAVRAVVTHIHNPALTEVSFSAFVTVTGGQDPHTLTVTAIDDRGVTIHATRKLFTAVAFAVDAPAIVIDVLSPLPFDEASIDEQTGSIQYMLLEVANSVANLGKVLAGPNFQITNADVGKSSRLRIGIWIEDKTFPVLAPAPPDRPLPTVPSPGVDGGFKLAPPVPVPATVASFGISTKAGLLQQLADGVAQSVKDAASEQGVTIDSISVRPSAPASVITQLSGSLPAGVPFGMTITEKVGVAKAPDQIHHVPVVVSSTHSSELGSVLDLIVAAVLSPFRYVLAAEFLELRSKASDADNQITGMMQSLLAGIPTRFPFNRSRFFQESSTVLDFPAVVLDWKTFGVAGTTIQGSGLTTIEARQQSDVALSISGPTVISGFQGEMDLVLRQTYTFSLTDLAPYPNGLFQWTVSGLQKASGTINSPDLSQSGQFTLVFPLPRNVKVGNWAFVLTVNATEFRGKDKTMSLTATASLNVVIEVKPNPRN